jgi:inosine/xanthosine triphosphatase
MNPIKLFVAIGTKNPAKIQAVIDAFQYSYSDSKVDLEFKPIQVDSGVGNQPIGLDMIINGAISRAKSSFNQFFYDTSLNHSVCFGVGIESGLVEISQSESGYMDFQFVAIYHNEKITLGSGSAFEYPKMIISNLLSRKSREIGEIFEKLSGVHDIKQKEGAIGYLSKGKIKRTDILKQGVIMALLPIINKNLYSI